MIVYPSELESTNSVFVTGRHLTRATVKNINFTTSLQDRSACKERPRSRFQNCLLAIILLFLLFIIGLAGLAAFLQIRNSRAAGDNSCKTLECIQTASQLLLSMNQTADPCDDFNQFACGNFARVRRPIDGVVRNSWFLFTTENMENAIKDIINNISSNDAKSFGKLKDLWDSCIHAGTLQGADVKSMSQLLVSLSLPGTAPNNDTAKEFDVMEVIARVQKLLDLDIFFSTTSFIYKKINIMLMLQPPLNPLGLKGIITPEEQLQMARPASNKLLQATLGYIANVLQHFKGPGKNDTSTAYRDSETEAMQILIFKSKWAGLLQRYNTKVKLGSITFRQLQENIARTPNNKVDFQRYVKILTEDVSGAIDFQNTTIILRNTEFFLGLPGFLATFQNISIQRFVWWQVVEHIIQYSGPTLSNIWVNYMKKVQNIHFEHHWNEACVKQMKKLAPLWIIYEMVRQRPNPQMLKSVGAMMTDIHDSFRDSVKVTEWLDADSKNKTLEKAENVKHFIGYPEWLSQYDKLHEMFKEFRMTKEQYLKNVVSFKALKMKNTLISMVNNRIEQAHNPIWNTDTIFETNAFYYPRGNAIIIPIGILQLPFYGRGLEAFNYGSMGAILGHELIHGFDTRGINYDKDGLISMIWNTEVTSKFLKLSECFVHQYNQYVFHGHKVNGRHTLAENIADNGGLRHSFRAYRRHLKRHGPERKLPGLEKYSNEQLFFLAFGNMWCDVVQAEHAEALLADVHCPSAFRIFGTLSNSKEFAEVWQCPKNSPMNPENKCVIW